MDSPTPGGPRPDSLEAMASVPSAVAAAGPSEPSPSMTPVPVVEAELDPELIEYVARKHALAQRHKSGSGWFYWIAAMSLINSALGMLGSSTRFVTGLGITRFFEVLAAALGKDPGLLASLAKGLAVVVAGVAIITFGVLARQARAGKGWAYLAGIIIYAADTAILLLFQDWMSIAFHVWALYSVYQGMVALKALDRIQAPPARSIPAPAETPVPEPA